MDRRGPSLTAADIADFEHRMRHMLPEDYKQFLLDVNGGRPSEENCQFSAGIVNGFFSLKEPKEARDLDTWNERVRRDIGTDELIVVGTDEGGARILVAIAGKHQGEVWMQITTDARPADANPRVLWHARRDVRKLADSFEQFMKSLKPLP